jgi:hypothetical protein
MDSISAQIYCTGWRKKEVPFYHVFHEFWTQKFFHKMILLGVIRCGELIARIPEVWKYFPDPDSGKNCVCEEKMVI